MDPPSFPLRSAFLALPLEGEAKWQFQATQEALKPFEELLNFQNPHSPHLTLQFWRELMEIEYGDVQKKAGEIAGKTSPFELAVTGYACFEKRGEVRVVFLDIAYSQDLAKLKKRCPWSSDTPFAPHITLARVRHPQGFNASRKQIEKALKDVSFVIPVDRLRLYGEVNGVQQTPLQEFVFPGTSIPPSSE